MGAACAACACYARWHKPDTCLLIRLQVVNGHPTRLLIDDSTWARASEKALREWRATLFGRMAQEYSKLEKRESEGGAKQIGRCGGRAGGLPLVMPNRLCVRARQSMQPSALLLRQRRAAPRFTLEPSCERVFHISSRCSLHVLSSWHLRQPRLVQG